MRHIDTILVMPYYLNHHSQNHMMDFSLVTTNNEAYTMKLLKISKNLHLWKYFLSYIWPFDATMTDFHSQVKYVNIIRLPTNFDCISCKLQEVQIRPCKRAISNDDNML